MKYRVKIVKVPCGFVFYYPQYKGGLMSRWKNIGFAGGENPDWNISLTDAKGAITAHMAKKYI